MSKLHYSIATDQLRRGGVIAYPTEAVWGLGCDPWNQRAVARLLAIKNRAADKGLILVAADMSQLQPLLSPLTTQQLKCLNESWPGPVTWLIPDPENSIPQWIKGKYSTVAIRVSQHPVIRQLCNQFSLPIVSTSANEAGETAIRSSLKLRQKFSAEVDYILPGSVGGQAQPSEIRDLASGNILRQGG